MAYLWCANRVVCVSSPKAFMQAVALVSTFWILLFFFFFPSAFRAAPLSKTQAFEMRRLVRRPAPFPLFSYTLTSSSFSVVCYSLCL